MCEKLKEVGIKPLTTNLKIDSILEYLKNIVPVIIFVPIVAFSNGDHCELPSTSNFTGPYETERRAGFDDNTGLIEEINRLKSRIDDLRIKDGLLSLLPDFLITINASKNVSLQEFRELQLKADYIISEISRLNKLYHGLLDTARLIIQHKKLNKTPESLLSECYSEINFTGKIMTDELRDKYISEINNSKNNTVFTVRVKVKLKKGGFRIKEYKRTLSQSL